MTKHVHFDMIVESAADTSRVVQEFSEHSEEWFDVDGAPTWDPKCEFRFKPIPKPDVVRHLSKYPHRDEWYECDSDLFGAREAICITRDGETGKIIKAEVVK